MARKDPGPETALFINTERKDGYFHIRAHAVLLHTEKHGSIRNPRREDLVRGLQLDSLSVTSQGNERHWDGSPEADPKLYGFNTCYHDLYHVEERQALTMGKTLKTINQRLQKMTEVRGYAATFGEYVGRVAEAIGATTIVERLSGEWGYDRGSYRFHTLADGRARIHQLEEEWKQKVRPTPAVTEADAVEA